MSTAVFTNSERSLGVDAMMVADPVYFAYLMASFSGAPAGVMVQRCCLRCSEEVHEKKTDHCGRISDRRGLCS